jgi:tetratricopeptide (TPR) repeat protein
METHDGLKKQGKADVPVPPDLRVELTPADYLAEMKAQFERGKRHHAYGLAKEAVVKYPDDPLILSWYGYLQAITDVKYRTGIETCKRALSLLAKKAMFGEAEIYAVVYFNLGKVYLAAGMKSEAIESFRKGLKFDSHNTELLKELRGLGTRKERPVAFLGRSNPINKYLGKVLHKPGNKHGGGQRSPGHGQR